MNWERVHPGSVDIIGSTTLKRLREEDSLLTGEIQTKFQKKEKMSFSEIQNFWDCGGGGRSYQFKHEENRNLQNYGIG